MQQTIKCSLPWHPHFWMIMTLTFIYCLLERNQVLLSVCRYVCMCERDYPDGGIYFPVLITNKTICHMYPPPPPYAKSVYSQTVYHAMILKQQLQLQQTWNMVSLGTEHQFVLPVSKCRYLRIQHRCVYSTSALKSHIYGLRYCEMSLGSLQIDPRIILKSRVKISANTQIQVIQRCDECIMTTVMQAMQLMLIKDIVWYYFHLLIFLDMLLHS